ncbi:mirror-image polydactyly 1 protein-like isoform X1 [Biomphalaria pfeifferi]|uniref:Mirror-image polydactyly 1 protein-like isoform X1 n=1 Tax=Biomphalaria pfeifferi TaxID=112525 RepID=A0AAD8B9W7_BIOPF|nr:mirror-image polydactyly 1 protein-like isoform X1 [Biomphalaria pfeifferi]
MDDVKSAYDVNKFTYKRRLDRAPDKQFKKLQINDKVAVGSLRKALEEAKFRIIKLRDENDEKECIIDEEKMLRKAAEEKLQTILVDLYNNPEVNLELQNRLPKAKKHKIHEFQNPSLTIASNEDIHVKDASRPKVSAAFSDPNIHSSGVAEFSDDFKKPVEIYREEFSPSHGNLIVHSREMSNDSSHQLQSSSESLVSPQMTPGMPLTHSYGSILSTSLSSMESSLYQALPSYGGVVSERNSRDKNPYLNIPLATSRDTYTDPSMTSKDTKANQPENENRIHHNSVPYVMGQSQTSVHSPLNPNMQHNSHPYVHSNVTDGQTIRVQSLLSPAHAGQSYNPVTPNPTGHSLNQVMPTTVQPSYQAASAAVEQYSTVPSVPNYLGHSQTYNYNEPALQNISQSSYKPTSLSGVEQYSAVHPSVFPISSSLASNTGPYSVNQTFFPSNIPPGTNNPLSVYKSNPANSLPPHNTTANDYTPPFFPVSNSFLTSSAIPVHNTFLTGQNLKGQNDYSTAFIPVTSSLLSSIPAHPTASASQNLRTWEAVQVSNMTRLLAELSTLKKENNELREDLKKVKQENELLTKGPKTDKIDSFETVGALIEDVRAAEKKHSDAAKLLVQAADDDKLAALTELEIIKSAKSLRRTLSESDISEADSYTMMRSESKRRQSKSSASSQVPIEHLIRRQREIMKEEMQRVIDQRNEARQKVLKLEKKLCSLEMVKSSENNNDMLMAKLKVIEEERDLLLAKFQFLMQDIGETKLVYNLHKALVSDEAANDINTYQSYKEADTNVNNKVKAQLAKESEDKNYLETKLTSMQKENLAQAECIEKLQQVIQRQRHKLNTLCAGPMLIE